MAEVLGVVAAAAQLAAMAMGLADAVQKIKGATKTLRKYQEQLIEIQHLAESIPRSPVLQTPDVECQIKSILSIISQTNLEQSLQRSWFFRVYTLILKEKDLIESFSIIDRKKQNLALVLHGLQAQTLHQLQLEVQVMNTNPRSEKPCPTLSNPYEEYRANKEVRKLKRNCSTFPSTQGLTQKAAAMPNLPGQLSDTLTETTKALKAIALEGATDLLKNGPGSFARSYYVGITAGDRVNTRVGAILDPSAFGKGSGEHGRDPEDEGSELVPGSGQHQINPDGVDCFVDIRKQGRGDLTVGVQTIGQGSAAESDEAQKPLHNAVYIDTRHEGVGDLVDEELTEEVAAKVATMTVGVLALADTQQQG